MIEITHVRMHGGHNHEHISDLRWRQASGVETGQSTRSEIVSWLESPGARAIVSGRGRDAEVLVVSPAYGQKYLRTAADGQWTNNLLSLPKF